MANKRTITYAAIVAILCFLFGFALDDQARFITFIVMIVFAFIGLIFFSARDWLKARDYERERQMVRAAEAVAMSDKRSLDEASLELATLELCLETIDKQLERCAETTRYRWELRRTFCKKFKRLIKVQHNSCKPVSLTDEQKDEILNTHHLLSDTDVYPPDPDEMYSEKEWYLEMKEKVKDYAQTLTSPTEKDTDSLS